MELAAFAELNLRHTAKRGGPSRIQAHGHLPCGTLVRVKEHKALFGVLAVRRYRWPSWTPKGDSK
jgi:hypothetical protein